MRHNQPLAGVSLVHGKRVLLGVALAIAGCGNDDSTAKAPAPPVSPDIAESITSAMDASADPCTDFYRYACGGWLDETALGADQVVSYRGFSMAQETLAVRLGTITSASVDDPGDDPDLRRIGTFFASCSDEALIESQGLEPLAPYLKAIAGIANLESAMQVLARLHVVGISAAFTVSAYGFGSDLATPVFAQPPLPLGDPRAYSRDDDASNTLRQDYQDHVARMLARSGEPVAEAAANAAKVVAFEAAMAKAASNDAPPGDPPASDGTGLGKLQAQAPTLPWKTYVDAAGLDGLLDGLLIANPEFFTGLDRLISTTPPGDLREYLRWSLVHQTAIALPKDFRDDNFDFFGRELTGQSEASPHDTECLEVVRSLIPDSVGKAYADRYFSSDDRHTATDLVESLKQIFRDDLPGVRWLDGPARAWARDKSLKTLDQIGYPDAPDRYEGLSLGTSYFDNVREASRHGRQNMLARIGKPTDRDAWPWGAVEINAAYVPGANVVNCPAGILEAPFFSSEAPAGANYGAIGAIIGHEVTHGFDTSGSVFGADGTYGSSYWSRAVSSAFDERVGCVRDQFDAYETLPGLHVDGSLTLDENIADLGGIKLAFKAFEAQKEAATAAQPRVAGLSDEQLFFVSWGQMWCSKASNESIRLLSQFDPHAPARARVIGPLSNTPAFAEAFACKRGDAMVRADRCEVW